jgi:hypothetical protein
MVLLRLLLKFWRNYLKLYLIVGKLSYMKRLRCLKILNLRIVGRICKKYGFIVKVFIKILKINNISPLLEMLRVFIMNCGIYIVIVRNKKIWLNDEVLVIVFFFYFYIVRRNIFIFILFLFIPLVFFFCIFIYLD